MKCKRSHQRGMSLIQVMIAAGMISGLMLVLMQLGKQQSQVSRKADQSLEVQVLLSSIYRDLSSPDRCIQNFEQLDTNNSGQFKNKTLTKTIGGQKIDVLKKGMRMGTLTVQEYEVNPHEYDPEKFTLDITFSRSSHKPQQIFKRSVEFYFSDKIGDGRLQQIDGDFCIANYAVLPAPSRGQICSMMRDPDGIKYQFINGLCKAPKSF